MDRTVLRRSEPSSRTTLMGEQPNPWDLLQPQDVMSRHRILCYKFYQNFMKLQVPFVTVRHFIFHTINKMWSNKFTER